MLSVKDYTLQKRYYLNGGEMVVQKTSEVGFLGGKKSLMLTIAAFI